MLAWKKFDVHREVDSASSVDSALFHGTADFLRFLSVLWISSIVFNTDWSSSFDISTLGTSALSSPAPVDDAGSMGSAPSSTPANDDGGPPLKTFPPSSSGKLQNETSSRVCSFEITKRNDRARLKVLWALYILGPGFDLKMVGSVVDVGFGRLCRN